LTQRQSKASPRDVSQMRQIPGSASLHPGYERKLNPGVRHIVSGTIARNRG
jgi:hypothetical protein